MARILKKIPNFKLPKYKMRDIDEIEELKVEYTPEDLEELKKRIIENRKAVLKNKRIRKKTRIACLSSYLGFGFVRFLFGFARRTG